MAKAFDQTRCGLPSITRIQNDPVIQSCAVPDPPLPIPECAGLPLDVPPPLADIPCPAIDIIADVMTMPAGFMPRVTVVSNNITIQQHCDQQCHTQFSFLFQLPSPQIPQFSVGPKGDPGDTGPPGPQGPQGAQGPQGPQRLGLMFAVHCTPDSGHFTPFCDATYLVQDLLDRSLRDGSDSEAIGKIPEARWANAAANVAFNQPDDKSPGAAYYDNANNLHLYSVAQEWPLLFSKSC